MSVWTDLHNHVIPGVDDGARSREGARAAVAALAAQGVARIVATPHVDGSLTANPRALDARLAELDEGWARLEGAIPDDAGVEVDRGAEIKLDSPEVDLSDPRLRLAGSRAALVEFAYLTVPPRSPEALARIVEAGYQPVLAHPERYRGMGGSLKRVGAWLEAGAYLQVNAGSVLGRYGDRAEEIALALLQGGWAQLMGSDYHARGEPEVAAARRLIEGRGGAEQARLLFEENPTRLLDDQRCLAVPPLARRVTLGRRLKRWIPWT